MSNNKEEKKSGLQLAKKKKNSGVEKLPFDKNNYLLMIAGVVALVIGFIVMSLDSETYGFGTLGLTVGPIIVMIGFTIEIFAIMLRPKDTLSK